MKNLTVRWQRLTEEGETCSRCGNTEEELQAAVGLLERALGELEMEVKLEKEELNSDTFKAAPRESNRIWVAEEPLEDIIGARVGESLCCDICGENQCRTLKFDGEEYETVPRQLILKAGLKRAAELLEVQPAGCCGEGNGSDECCSSC